MLEEATGRFGAEDSPALPPTMPENVALMGEYIEPAPRYYINPNDQ
ncbi:unnamed protein product [Dibothriocephalus latus]|uniref:Uncharacterized protein n=1 Tax=Dibothriocephalus latus TaxID=60516 RepID=A0A3P7NBP0_DIBLA|nr:unnamed protein product [Dibothriocephalus latus]